jgi:hypothetical protein
LCCLQEPTEVERELDGVNVVRMAHEACYVLWREESVARRAEADKREERA